MIGASLPDAGEADLIAIDKPFLANPDLVDRLRYGWPLKEPDAATFCTAGTKGYTDYPAYLPDVAAAAPKAIAI